METTPPKESPLRRLFHFWLAVARKGRGGFIHMRSNTESAIMELMKLTTILYIVLALIIGFGAGYLVFRNASPANTSLEGYTPIPKSKWDNKVITAWQADVKGNLVARDESSFTLSHAGNFIVLPLTPQTTFSDPKDLTNFKPVNFNALPLGILMKGVVNVDREKGIFGAGNFIVELE